MSNIGERKNSNKLRWRNFPKFLIRPMIEVGHFGETKYATFNFLKGLTVLDCLDSLDRHRDKLDDPNVSDIDDESKCHHLAHIAWNALVALYMVNNRPDLDDRFKGFNLKTEKTINPENIKTMFPDIIQSRSTESGEDESGPFVVLDDGQKLYLGKKYEKTNT